MILVDANLLLYAYHSKAQQHAASRAWLQGARSGQDRVDRSRLRAAPGLRWVSPVNEVRRPKRR
jgi:predicted nucleic acid-binding protein